jgi:hypothetical protein
MKYLLKSFFVAASIMQFDLLVAQGPVNNSPANPNAAGATSAQFWSRQGNTAVNGTNNVFGTQAGFNSQIWYSTNGFYRMMMDNGSNAITQGRISMGLFSTKILS